MKTESQILAEVLDSTRNLTRFFLSKLKDQDPNVRFQMGDFQTNSVAWVIAHLTWAEDFLILQGVGNASLNLPWYAHFRIGTPYPDESSIPPRAEVWDAFQKVHTLSMDLLRAFPDERLTEDNHTGIGFGGDLSKRMIIQHCIRHEGNHGGQLNWLARLYGLKIV